MDRRVLITGASGYLGSMAAEILSRAGWKVSGMDICAPRQPQNFSRFLKASVTDDRAMRRLFEEARPAVAVHLAFVVDASHDQKREAGVAIDGSRNFLECCARFNVQRVVFMSSVAAYGAFDDNDTPLTEGSPVRGVPGYSYSRLKAIADLMAQAFMREHIGSDVVILRPCLFVGRNTNNHFFDMLKFPVVPQVRDRKGVRDPLFQFIHEDDMAACLVAAVEKDVSGIFNVAADGQAKFSELVRMTGKRSVAVPASLIYPATALMWHARLLSSPPAQVDFIRYPWLMDCSRMKKELYVPKMNGMDAFREFVRTHKF